MDNPVQVIFVDVKDRYFKTQKRIPAASTGGGKSGRSVMAIQDGRITFLVYSTHGQLDANQIIACLSRTERARENLPPRMNGDSIGLLEVSFEYIEPGLVAKCVVNMGTLVGQDSCTHPAIVLTTMNPFVTNVFSLRVCYGDVDALIGESQSFLLTSNRRSLRMQ